MKNIDSRENTVEFYDIVVCGGGVAGLWLLNILVKAGFNVLLLEKDAIGGVQTIASQGMIHGGQRYLLGSKAQIHAKSVAQLPDRWDACLEGRGELDLSRVRVLSKTQVMWPAGGCLTHLALSTTSHMLKTKTRKLDVLEVPEALADLRGLPVYELPEKVLDIASLVEVLSTPHRARIKRGRVDSLSRDGCLSVTGVEIKAQIIICAAGLGNEELLVLIDAGKGKAQHRPLRQIMVKPMPFPLFGHGITTSYKPRVTVTSHPLSSGDYVWYLGGAIADNTLELSEEEVLVFAKKEMKELFVNLDWSGKQWSTWYGFRAEAYSENGRLPNGPVLQEYGKVLVIWPTKLTLAPLLGENILTRLLEIGVSPKHSLSTSNLNNLELPPLARLPWKRASWVR